MDFLEGFFLGKVWTDSDVRAKTIRSVYLLLSLFLLLGFGLALAGKGFIFKVSNLPSALLFAMTILLTLALPIVSAFYHRCHLAIKILILVLFSVQYIFAIACFSHVILPHITFDIAFMLQTAIQFAEGVIEKSSHIFITQESLLSTLVGVAIGCITIAFLGMLLLVFLIALPILLLLAIKWIHNFLSLLVSYILSHTERKTTLTR